MAKVRTARRAADGSVPQAAVQDDLQLWRLDTRYYTAELRLHQLPHTAEAVATDAIQSKLPRGACDAFLLLCDTAEVFIAPLVTLCHLLCVHLPELSLYVVHGEQADVGTKLRAWQTTLDDLGPSVQLCVASARGSALPDCDHRPSRRLSSMLA
jgi:hypothetical protein